jgi:saccharopine dehydrogenase-like NADP-dependent oxidoreductase
MKKVLLLGSGMCSKPIIDYLDGAGIEVTVGSRSKGDVKVSGTKHAKWVELDVEKPEGLAALDHWATKVDAVVSLLPYIFHPVAAKAALKANKHFLTASYVSDGIRALEAEFKAKGLVTINECGVDPGTDHASMRAVVERVHAQGGKITYFTSFAGGLPAPGQKTLFSSVSPNACGAECNDNPFGYKFSWAPKGVLLAGKNSASFYRDGKEVFIPGSELFKR